MILYNRIKNREQEKQEKMLEIAIEQDLIKYNNMKIGSLSIINNYGLRGEEKNISYLLRNYKRKMNIARKMEEENYIKNTREVLEEYKKEIIEKIELLHLTRNT